MDYRFWLVAGSQFLYGPEAPETVERRAREMAGELSGRLPYPLVCQVTAKTNQEVADIVRETSYASMAGTPIMGRNGRNGFL